jgi:O-antigen ligase
MNNRISIMRSLLIYGLCIPLAIYLGYLLANPMDRVSLGFVIAVLLLPLLPLLLRWHHLMLIICWNMSAVLFFIPGSPYLWILMTALSLGLTVLQHVLKRNISFAVVPSVMWPLLLLAVVIVVTIKLRGGIGISTLGSEAYGGKRYILLLGAIAGYFALASHPVPPGRCLIYVAFYFLGSLTLMVSDAGPWVPSSLYFIFALFPAESLQPVSGEAMRGEVLVRLTGVTMASVGATCFLLARHGMRGVLELSERWRFLPLRFRGGLAANQPWRLLFFLAAIFVSLMGGYRSYAIILGLTVLFLFHLEGLMRAKMMPAFVMLGIVLLVVGLPLVQKLPLSVQRSLSFLPIEVNPIIRLDAEASSEWRVKIWREVLPTIPQYLLVGRGYSINGLELEQSADLAQFNGGNDGSVATLATDFHNGPLSLIISLGIFGVIGFLWFLGAAIRVLLYNYRYGAAEHHRINTFLLVYFAVRVFYFFVIFGSFHTELTIFTGLIGLSVSLNGGMCRPAPAKAPAPNPAYLPFRLPRIARA